MIVWVLVTVLGVGLAVGLRWRARRVGTLRLGSYQLDAVLGSGTSGVVFRGVDATGRHVAVKVLDPRWHDDTEFVTRFRAEADVMRRIAHPNCVRVLDVIDDGAAIAIVSELVDGASLAAVLECAGRLTGPQASGVLSGALQGLAHMHDAGLLHRDVKPANILVTRDGVSKLADFGLASPVIDATGASAQVVGTPAYMSPEQARGAPLDARSDLYSCGAVLFELVCGRRVFATDDPHEAMRLHRDTDAPDVRSIDPGIPDPVAAVVDKALAKDPPARYQHATEFHDQLQDAADTAYGTGWLGAASLTAAVVTTMGAVAKLIQRGSTQLSRHVARLTPQHVTLTSATDERRKITDQPDRARQAAGSQSEGAVQPAVAAPPGLQLEGRRTRTAPDRSGPARLIPAGFTVGQAILGVTAALAIVVGAVGVVAAATGGPSHARASGPSTTTSSTTTSPGATTSTSSVPVAAVDPCSLVTLAEAQAVMPVPLARATLRAVPFAAGDCGYFQVNPPPGFSTDVSIHIINDVTFYQRPSARDVLSAYRNDIQNNPGAGANPVINDVPGIGDAAFSYTTADWQTGGGLVVLDGRFVLDITVERGGSPDLASEMSLAKIALSRLPH